MSFIETTYRDRTYTVPEAGRGASSAMLSEIPSDDYALAFLMQDGDLGVPGGHYGRSTSECAPIALLLAKIMQDSSGDQMTYYGLDSDMGLVVNSHDDVAYAIYNYGAQVIGEDFDVRDYLDDEQIALARSMASED